MRFSGYSQPKDSKILAAAAFADTSVVVVAFIAPAVPENTETY